MFLLATPVHELLHYAAFRRCGVPAVALSIGLTRGMNGYCRSAVAVTRDGGSSVCAVPGLVLGVLPLIAAGDLLRIWNARRLPVDTMVGGEGARRSSSRSRR